MIIHMLTRYYHRFRPFTDSEAWAIFRIAAFAEAIGWTLLIFGVASQQLPVSWHDIPVLIAGRIHGMLFAAYIMAVLACGSSLGWSIFKTVIAGCFSVPPYGSLIFEQWEARQRRNQRARVTYRTSVYRSLTLQTAGLLK